MCLNKWVQTKVYEPILPHFSPNCNKYFKKYFKKLFPSGNHHLSSFLLGNISLI